MPIRKLPMSSEASAKPNYGIITSQLRKGPETPYSEIDKIVSVARLIARARDEERSGDTGAAASTLKDAIRAAKVLDSPTMEAHASAALEKISDSGAGEKTPVLKPAAPILDAIRRW